MTDDERLELASSYLDGEVTPTERALVASDPELQDLVEQLAGVRDRLASTAPAPLAHSRDRNIGAAMDAFRAATSGAPPSLTAVRARRSRRRWSTTTLPIAAVATLLVAVLGIGTLWLANDDDGGDDFDVAATAAQTDSAGEAAEGDGGDQLGQTGVPDTEASTGSTQPEAPLAAGGGGDTGSAADESASQTTAAASAQAAAEPGTGSGGQESSATAETTADTLASTTVASETESVPTTAATDAGEATATTAGASPLLRSSPTAHPCDAALRAGPPDRDLGSLLAVGPVSDDGSQLLVYERDQGSGSVALEVDPATCQVMSSVAPPPGP